MATASPMWSPCPWVTSMMSQRSIESAVRGERGLPNHGSMRMTLPPGVRTSTQAWPYQVNVVSRPSPMRFEPPVPTMLATRLHSRSCPPHRSPRTSPSSTGPLLTGLALGHVRGGRPAATSDERDDRLPRLHHVVRHRVRHPGLALRRRAADLARRLAGRRRSGLGRAAPSGARRVLPPRHGALLVASPPSGAGWRRRLGGARRRGRDARLRGAGLGRRGHRAASRC